MSLTARVRLLVSGTQTAARDLGTAQAPFEKNVSVSYADGVAADQADRVWHDQRTLAASATEDLDLAAVLIDALSGAALTFAKIKAVIIAAAEGNTNDVQVTRPAANGVPLFLANGDGIAVKPGGAFSWFLPGTGVTVTAGTGDLLTITNSGAGTPVTYDVIVIGTSA